MEKTKIGFIGYGYVGSTWGEYLKQAHGYVRGRDVFCYDPSKNLLDDIGEAEIVIICVPTPINEKGECDLSLIYQSVSRTRNDQWIVIRSTIPPMTTARLARSFPTQKGFCHIPEFLTEAKALDDFCNPDRIIIAPASREFWVVDTLLSLLPRARALSVPSYPDDAYQRFEATSTEAELTKYFGNVMGAMKVHLAEMFKTASQFCEFLMAEEGINQRVDYDHVRRMAAADYRIGPSHLQSGHGGYRGFGGYCFIKDAYTLYSFFNEMWTFVKQNSAQPQLVDLLDHYRKFLEHMLAGNKTLLELQGLSEDEAMNHTVVLQEILKRKELKDVPDYLHGFPEFI